MSRTAYESVLASVKDAADLARVHEIATSYSLGPDAPEWTIVALFREGGIVEMRSMIETYQKISHGIIAGVKKEYLDNRDLVRTSNTEFLEQFKKLKTDIKDGAYEEIVGETRVANTEYFYDQLHKRNEEERQKIQALRNQTAIASGSKVGLQGVIFGWIMGIVSGASTVAAYAVSKFLGVGILGTSIVLTIGIIFVGIYYSRKGMIS